MAEMYPKMVKISLLFTPGGQNMKLRNKSHEIKIYIKKTKHFISSTVMRNF